MLLQTPCLRTNLVLPYFLSQFNYTIQFCYDKNMIETLTSSPLFLILLFPVGTLTIFVIGLIRVDIRDLRGKETAGQKLALEEE